MRERQSARLLVANPANEVLLFHFRHTDDALAGQSHWATPGGGLEVGESFEAAAIRELFEETGIRVDSVDAPVGFRRYALLLPSGEQVISVERYYLVRVTDKTLCRDGWTTHEQQVMAEHRWWSVSELRATAEQVWPETLIEMLEAASCNVS